MSHDSKMQVDKHVSIIDKFYIPFLILDFCTFKN